MPIIRIHDEVLDPKPMDVAIGRRRLTDHERFLSIMRQAQYTEYYNSLRHLPDDDDFEFDFDDVDPPPVPQQFETLEVERQARRKERFFSRMQKKLSPKAPDPVDNAPPAPLNGVEDTQGAG